MRKSRFCFVTLAAAALCTGDLFAQQAQQQQPGQQRQQAQPQQNAQAKQIVAKVNGDAITKVEVEQALQPHLQAQPETDRQMEQALRQRVLESLIESRLVEQFVLKNGPEVKKDEVDAVVSRFKEQVESQGIEFDDFLASRGEDEDLIKRRIKGSLAWQKYQTKTATEPKLQQYFQQNQERFQGDEYAQVREQVAQAYLAEVWEGIVKETRPDAKIEVAGKERSQGAQRR